MAFMSLSHDDWRTHPLRTLYAGGVIFKSSCNSCIMQPNINWKDTQQRQCHGSNTFTFPASCSCHFSRTCVLQLRLSIRSLALVRGIGGHTRPPYGWSWATALVVARGWFGPQLERCMGIPLIDPLANCRSWCKIKKLNCVPLLRYA